MAQDVEVGTVFGAWTVLELIDGRKCRCRCLCGFEKELKNYDLQNAKTTMCRSCAVSVAHRSHGASDSDVYNIWVHINQRCYNPKNKDYPAYGGRGIDVCPLWRKSYEAFSLMMGPRPPDYTIERIDYNKGYSPENCKWLSRAEQTRNKRDNVNVEIDGVTKTVSEWCEEGEKTQASAFTVYKRISRGWDPKEALTAPVRKRTK